MHSYQSQHTHRLYGIVCDSHASHTAHNSVQMNASKGRHRDVRKVHIIFHTTRQVMPLLYAHTQRVWKRNMTLNISTLVLPRYIYKYTGYTHLRIRPGVYTHNVGHIITHTPHIYTEVSIFTYTLSTNEPGRRVVQAIGHSFHAGVYGQ